LCQAASVKPTASNFHYGTQKSKLETAAETTQAAAASFRVVNKLVKKIA
jgi:hypothetical protein